MSESTHADRSPSPARDAERGSAYLFVLLGLLVLTIIGLSLVVVTQTEAQIGGAEKSAARVLFGAESGLHAQVGLHFLELDPLENQFTLDTHALEAVGTTDVVATLEETVNVSPFYPIYAGPCALCSMNFQGEQRYWVNNYVVNAQASRYTAGGCTEIPQAQKLLSEMFMIQPEPLAGGGIDTSIRTYDPGISGSSDPCDKGLVEIVY